MRLALTSCIRHIVGVGTKIDPTLCRADRLVGQVLGAVGALPNIYTELEISYFLLRRLLGVRTEGDRKAAKVQKLSKNEVLMVNIGSLSSGGRVLAVKNDLAKIGLTNPVCTEIGEKIALSRRIEKHWRYTRVTTPPLVLYNRLGTDVAICMSVYLCL